jgi:hypothetical protein
MQVSFYLVKAFLRQALKDANGDWVSNPQTAIDALTALQTGQYETATDNDTTVVMTSTAGKTFQFQPTPGLSRTNLIAIAEQAIEIVESYVEANAKRSPQNMLTDDQLIESIRKRTLRTTRRTRASFLNG